MQYESNDPTDRVKKLKQKRKELKKQRRRRAAAAAAAAASKDKQVSRDQLPQDKRNHIDEEEPVDDHVAKTYFQHVFDRFSVESHQEPVEDLHKSAPVSVEKNDRDMQNEGVEPVSRKKLKRMMRFTVEELKQLAKLPEVVEAWDANAPDPALLLALKSYRNTVPVPAHWKNKRPYLERRRVPEKPAFELPDFIKRTGISEIRDAIREKEAAAARGRAKRRARLNPKLGKMDLDYQKLYEAFFVYQTRPKLTIHGDIYHEGKEHMDAWKNRKPGELSDSLKSALGITADMPPPWLYAMQRYGPPPSYPFLKIPGVNAPIPAGAEWGYHRGGWGCPPVDIFNRPLYGDVFGVLQQEQDTIQAAAEVDRTLWGEIEFDLVHPVGEDITPEQSDDDESMDMNEVGEDTDMENDDHGKEEEIVEIEIPGSIELRKDTRKADHDGNNDADEKDYENSENSPMSPRTLYKILKPKPTTIRGFMGSQHTYTGM
ncbi:hypothetical protein VTP01DRAFT_6204 [Rhizomucor pusillus]|uniref:uncharacterized protein n=1 Tax=Rhizomucor pusillus TaxID=4840 RepID=UPI00374344C1